ncbi:MAG: hypothetical protein Q9160_002159 [Pyrenula sp. 1 TL-2023]
MSKVDSKQDYYADLELKPNADAEDVKRQFRKLAKLYHPDRNPGKEFEYNAKFQAIQAAHEVLADPQQRAKYDAERQKAAAANTFSTQYRPGGTPKSTPTSAHFPPPPKRPGAEKTRYPTSGVHKPPPTAGNQRFAKFQGGAAEWKKSKDDAEAIPQFSRAWQKMGPRQAPPTAPPPPPRPTFNPTAPRPAPPPPPQPEPSAYSNGWNGQNMGNAGFPGLNRSQSTRKRPGYAPATPGTYNEPMAPPNTSAYHHVSRGDRPQAARPQSYFDLPPQSPTMPHGRTVTSPLRHAKSQEDPTKPQRPRGQTREPRSYARTPGERTYVGSGVSRSTSLRNSPVDPKYEDHGFERPQSHHGTRNHSAGPHSRKAFEVSDSSSDTSSSDSDGIESIPRPTATPHGRLGRMKPEDGHWHAGSNLNSPKQGPIPHHEYPPPPRSVPNAVYVDGTDRAGPGFHATTGGPNGNMYGPFLSTARRWSQEWGFSSKEGRESSDRKDPFWALPATISPECLAKKPPILSDARSAESSSIPSPSTLPKQGLPQFIPFWKANPSLHSSPPNSPVVSPQAPPKSSAHDRLHGPFFPHAWTQEFSNSEHFAPPPSREKSPSKTSNSRGRAYSKGRTASPVKDAEALGVPHSNYDAGSAFVASPKPQRVSTTAKASNGATSVPGIDVYANKSKTQSHARDSGQSLDAMDIDDISLDASAEPQMNGNTLRPSSHKLHTEGGVHSRSTSGGVNLNDLSNVAPFAPSASGLDGMDELGGDLPFESRPAASVHLNDTAKPSTDEPNLTKPPKAPEAPLDSDKLTRPVWDRYCKWMNAYMKEWQSYNNRVLGILNARQEKVNSSLADNWLTSIGDTDSNGKAGLKTYCGWIQDDEKFRAAWDIATERHREAMLDATRVRELAKQKASRGQL